MSNYLDPICNDCGLHYCQCMPAEQTRSFEIRDAKGNVLRTEEFRADQKYSIKSELANIIDELATEYGLSVDTLEVVELEGELQ